MAGKYTSKKNVKKIFNNAKNGTYERITGKTTGNASVKSAGTGQQQTPQAIYEAARQSSYDKSAINFELYRQMLEAKKQQQRVLSQYSMQRANPAPWMNGGPAAQLQAGLNRMQQAKEQAQRTPGFQDWSMASNLLDPNSRVNQLIGKQPQEEQEYWQGVRQDISKAMNRGKGNDRAAQLLRPLTIEERLKQRQEQAESMMRVAQGTPISPLQNPRQYAQEVYDIRTNGKDTSGNPALMNREQLEAWKKQNQRGLEQATRTDEQQARLHEMTEEAGEQNRIYYELNNRGLPVMRNMNGEPYVPDVAEWDGLDSTQFIRKRPEEYYTDDSTKTEYDRMMYDAIHGKGAYDAILYADETTDEDIDAMDAEAERLWQQLEGGNFNAEERAAQENYYGAFNRENDNRTNGYQRNIDQADRYIENWDRIAELEAGAPEGEYGYREELGTPKWTDWTDLNKMKIKDLYRYANMDLTDEDLTDVQRYGNLRPAQFMTDTQLNVFNGYVESGKYAEAQAYYDAMEPYLLQMKNEYRTLLEQRMYNNGGAIPMTLYRIATKPVEGVAGLGLTAAALLGNEEARNTNSEWWDLSRTNQNIQNTSADAWARQAAEWFGGGDEGFAAQAGRFLNGVFFSMADNLTAFALSGGASKVSADAAEKLTQHAIQFIMSSEASAGTMFEQLEAGVDPTRAGIMAFGSGIIEAITEKYSLEQILDPDVRAVLGTKGAFMKYLGKASFAEGSEEIASDLLDTGLDFIMSAVYGDSPELIRNYEALIAEGMSEDEATRKVLGDYLLQLGSDGLAGALSGLLMSGSRGVQARGLDSYQSRSIGSTVVNRNVESGMTAKEKSGEQYSNFLKLNDAAKMLQPGSEARMIAKEIEADVKKGGKVSMKKAGKLTRAIMKETNEQIGQVADAVLGDTLTQQLRDEGIAPEDAARYSEVLKDAVETGRMTPEAMLILSEDERARGLWSEIVKSEDVQNARAAQKSVMDLITTPGERAAEDIRGNVASKMETARYITEKDAEMQEALAAGEQRTGSPLEVVADGKIGNVTGFGLKEIRGENGTTWAVTAKVETADGTIEVDLNDVLSTNENAAKVLQMVQAENGQSIGEHMSLELLKIAQTTKDIAGAATDAISIAMDDLLGEKTKVTTLSKKEELALRAALEEDKKAGDAEAAKNRKQLKPGEATITLNGHEYGSHGFTQELGKYGAQIRDEANYVARLMKSIGMDVDFYYDNSEEGSARQGAFVGTKGIRLNLAGTFSKDGTHRSVVATAAHEATHWLRANAQDAYRQLQTYALQGLQKANVNVRSELRRIMDNYALYGEHLTMDKAAEEMTAMGCEEIFTNEQLVSDLQAEDPTLFGKVKQAVQHALNLLHKVAGENMATSSRRYAQKLRGTLDQLAKVWKITYEAAKGAKSAEGGTGAKQALMQYDQHTINNWKNSKSIVAYTGQQSIADFVNEALKNPTLNKNMYFGKIGPVLAELILQKTGVELEDADVVLNSYEVRKINKKHGNAASEAKMGQLPIGVQEFEDIVSIISEPDQIEKAGTYEGHPAITFYKNMGGWTTALTYAVPSKNKLRIETMYKNKNNRSLPLPSYANNAQLPSTSKTTQGTAPNRTVSQSSIKVKLSLRDEDYADAVARGDWTAAENMLIEKMQQTEGITGYRAPHFYAGEHKDIARLIKNGDQDVINSIADDMAQHVPENAVLVPMPPHEGKVTDSTDTKILADALSRKTGAPVIVALESDYHPSRYQVKASGDRSVNAQTMRFRQVAEIPEGKMPVFIDNIVGGGQTAIAAKNAIGRGITLAYAQSSRSKTKGVKIASVTYDSEGNLIPLSKRMDPENPSWKYSMRDDTEYDIRAWMESVPEWSLQTEAEKQLLGNYKSLRTKAGLDRLRMQKIDEQIRALEGQIRKAGNQEAEDGTPVRVVTVEDALKINGVWQVGKYLTLNGKQIGTLQDGILNITKDIDGIRDKLAGSGAFDEDERTGMLTSKAQNIHADDLKDAKRRLDALQIKKQNLQTVMDQTQEKLSKILGNEGFGRMMYQQQKVLDDLQTYGTQKELNEHVARMEKAAAAIAKQIDENRKATEALEKGDVVKRFRELLGTTSVEQTASELKKEFSSTWTAKQIRTYLDPIILKMKTGADFQQDVETLAGILVGSDSRNRYEALEDLRGLVITLGKGAQAELKAQNSSLKEVRARLAGTGIQVKYGDRSTLEADIEDLRAEYPMIPELGDEKDALGNFLNWVDSMKSASAGMEFYDQRIAEAMAQITGKAAGAAKGIYMPNDPKAQQQVLAMMDFVKGLNAETAEVQKTLADIAEQMAQMQKESTAATGNAKTLMRDVNVALDYYNRISKIAVDEAKQKKQSAVIEQLKSEHAKKILKNNEEWRAQIQRDADSRKQLEENRKAKSRINTCLKRLNNLLKNPKGLQNIPEHMQGLARETISKFIGNDYAGGNKLTTATREELTEMMRLLNAWEKQSGKFNPADLNAAEDVKTETMLADLDKITDGIRAWNNDIRGKNKLDILQQRGAILQGIQEAVSEIYTAIRTEGEVQVGDRRVAVEDAAYEVARGTEGKKFREWTGRLGQKMNWLHKAIVSGNMTPEYFFRTLGNKGLSDLWENYHWAENRNGLELKKAQQRLAEIAEEYGYRNWDLKEKIKLNLESGEVEVTLGQLMSLWATWQREQTLGPQMSSHLKTGGFYAEQDTREGMLGRATIEKRAHRVTENDMDYVLTKLTVDQMNFVDAVVKFMSRDMSELGNEASMQAYGIKLYKESYYFPFQMWDGVKSRKSNDAGGAAAANDRAFHPSFSKTRIHGANNAVVIGDFMQVATDHIAGMINYATMGLANEHLQKVLNAQTAEGYDTKRNTRALIEEAYGREAAKYLADLQAQLNGGAVHIDKTFYDRLISLFRKNAVAGSLSVALQQPLSYIRAAMMINPKYLARAISPDMWKGSYKEMLEHSGVAVIKDMGRFDMNFGQSAKEFLMPDGKEGKIRKVWEGIEEYSTKLPELMDRMTWTRMWSAVKAEQHAEHPDMDVKSDEFLDLCGKRFNDLMRRTQVYDSTLVKSANMRNQNPVIKTLTSFMAEPTLTLNVLADSVRMAKNHEKGGAQMVGKAGALFLLSAIMQAAVKGLMGTGRTPDDKKTWWENFLYRFEYNLLNEADPLQLVPGFSDMVTVLKGGELKDDAYGAISKMIKATSGTVDLLLRGPGDKGLYRDVEDSTAQLVQMFTGLPAKNIMRDLRAMWNWTVDQPYAERESSAAVISGQATDLFMNADNLWGVLNNWLGEAGYNTNNNAYYQRIYEAKKAGDEERAQSMIDYLLKGKGIKQESIDSKIAGIAKKDENASAADIADFLIAEGASATTYIKDQMKKQELTAEEARDLLQKAQPEKDANSIWWTVDRIQYQIETGAKEAPDGNYYRLWDAMNNNKATEIRTAVKTMTDHGMEPENIKKQITTNYKNAYMNGTSSEKVKIKDAIEKAYKELGYSTEDADKVINNWKKDTGSGINTGRLIGSSAVSDVSTGPRKPKRPQSEDGWGQYIEDLNEYWEGYDFDRHDPVGQYGEGTIDLNHRKVVHNPDGSISTELSTTVGFDDGVYLLPTVIDGKIVSEDEAIDYFLETVRKGKPEYLGRFDNYMDADEYAMKLHNRQDWYYHR